MDQYRQRRYGSSSTVVVNQSAPAQVAVQEPYADKEYTSQELRALGKSLDYRERMLGVKQSSLSDLQAQINRRKELGLSTAGHEARLARIQASYDTVAQDYQEFRTSTVGENNYGAAKKAAPKNYRTDLQNRGQPLSQSELDFQYRRQAMEAAKAGTANYQTVTGEVQQVTYGRNYSTEPAITQALRQNQGPLSPTPTLVQNINKQQQNTTRNAVNNISGSGNRRVDASYDIPSQESPRLQALERTSEYVAKSQKGFDKRIKNYDETLSYLSFGRGRPISERGFFGQVGQVGAGIITAPLYGPSLVVDSSILAAKKSFLYTGGIITPESRNRSIQELKSNTRIFKEVYTDPKTYAYAIAGGAAKGYADYNVARSVPRSVRFVGDSAVVSDASVAGGAISGSARVVGRAEASYRYGPLNVFRRTETVPFEGQAVYSGLRAGGRGQSYLVNVEGVGRTTIGNRAFTSDVNYVGRYSSRSGRLSLINKGQQTVFLSRSGQGVPTNSVTGARTAPSQTVVLRRNRAGVYAVDQTARGRGVAEGGVINQLSLRRGREGLTREGFSYAESPTQIVGGRSRYVADTEQFITAQRASAGNSRLIKAGFSDLERYGYYQDPLLRTPRESVRDATSSLFRSRKGSVSSGYTELQTIFQPPTRVVRSRTSFGTSRAPSFAGLPFGEVQSTAFRLPGLALLAGQRSRQLQQPRNASRLATRPLEDTSTMPDTRFDMLPRTLPRQEPSFDYRSRQSYDFVPQPQTPPTMFSFTTGFSRPPPMPTPGFPFGGGGDSRGSYGPGKSSGKRKYQYVPDYFSQYFNIRATKGQRKRLRGATFTGLEARPV